MFPIITVKYTKLNSAS